MTLLSCFRNHQLGRSNQKQKHGLMYVSPSIWITKLTDAINSQTMVPSEYAEAFLKALSVVTESVLETFFSRAKIMKIKLKKCNETALVLPYDACIKTYRDLIRQNYTDVYIGKERHFEKSTDLMFRGTWPFFLVKRLRLLLGEIGIWNWWEHMLQTDSIGNLQIQRKPENFHPPNMAGNVLVLFAVFLGGCSLGLLLIFLEIITHAGAFFRKCFIWFLQLLRDTYENLTKFCNYIAKYL